VASKSSAPQAVPKSKEEMKVLQRQLEEKDRELKRLRE
jgi:hypothetical protein